MTDLRTLGKAMRDAAENLLMFPADRAAEENLLEAVRAFDKALSEPPAARPKVHHLGAALQGIADRHADILTPREAEALYIAAGQVWDTTLSEPPAALVEIEALVTWLRCNDHEFCHEAATALETLSARVTFAEAEWNKQRIALEIALGLKQAAEARVARLVAALSAVDWWLDSVPGSESIKGRIRAAAAHLTTKESLAGDDKPADPS